MTQEFLHPCKNELKNAKEAVTISSMGEITMQMEHTETLQLDYELPEYPEIDPRYRRAPRRRAGDDLLRLLLVGLPQYLHLLATLGGMLSIV